MAKKGLKIGGIIIGSIVGVSVLGLAIIGGGQICTEMYYDPENWKHTIFQTTMLGYDHILGLGWAA